MIERKNIKKGIIIQQKRYYILGFWISLKLDTSSFLYWNGSSSKDSVWDSVPVDLL